MNNEIKEILELFAFTDENIMFGDIVELNSKQSHLLLDYITNLQQAIKDTKDTADDMLFELKQENSKLEIALQNIQEDYDRRAKENEILTNNWNELEEFIKNMLFTTPHENQMLDFILDKMKEIKDNDKFGT